MNIELTEHDLAIIQMCLSVTHTGLVTGNLSLEGQDEQEVINKINELNNKINEVA